MKPPTLPPPPIAEVDPASTPFQKLKTLIRPEKTEILAVLAFAITIGLLQLATPIAVQAIVNAVAFGGQLQGLIVISSLLLLALTFASTLYCIQTLTVELLQQRLLIRLVADLTARLPRVQIEAYNSGHGPELVNRFFDILTIQKSAPKLLIDALGTALAVIVGLSVLAVYHPLLLVFDLFLIAVILLIFLMPLKNGERTAIHESSAKYEVAAWLEEIVRNPYTFRNGGAQQWIFEKADELTMSWIQSRKSHFRIIFNQIISVQFLYVISSVVLLGLGGWLVINGSLSIGQLVAAELIVSGIVYSVSKSGKHLETWYDLMAAVYKVNQLLDVSIHRTEGEQPPENNPDKGTLAFSQVSWVGARENDIRPSITLSIAAGEKLAITGPRGSGKTSLIDLLWLLNQPATGSIHLSGMDLRDYSIDALRKEVSVVSHIEVVNGTISENVSLYRDFVSSDDVRRAIASVGLEEVIASLPDRINTKLHPHGKILSEDELRRLMLARAIAGSPSVLAVDSLFDQSPPCVQDTIFKTLLSQEAPWTLLIISELPKVLESCDRVLRIDAENNA